MSNIVRDFTICNRRSIKSTVMIYGAILTLCVIIQVTNANHQCFDVNSNVNWTRVARQNDCGVSKAHQSHLLDRIMGGNDAGLGEFPWMARVVYGFGETIYYRCGGSLIHKNYVLTAGHCCLRFLFWELVSVRLGEYDTLTDRDCYRGHCAPKHVDIKVEKIYRHDEYNMDTRENDICLLKLQKAVQFSDYIYPVCLPVDYKMQTYEYEHENFTAAGWGDKDGIFGRTVNILQKLNLTAVPRSACDVSIGADQICTGRRLGENVCGGDFGGPLMYMSTISGRARQYVVGLVSYGQPCSDLRCIQKPFVYTNVAHYLPWIFNTIVDSES